jgi:hypothetical protein
MKKQKNTKRTKEKLNKTVDRELLILEEFLADKDYKKELKFGFNFKEYFPERGVVIYKDAKDKKGRVVGEFTYIEGDEQGDINDPYYKMQIELRHYHMGATGKAYILGKDMAERDLFRWIKKNYSEALFHDISKKYNYAKIYCDVIAEKRISRPGYDELEEATGISNSTWRRCFSDPVFLYDAKKETQLRRGWTHSKGKEKNIGLWNSAEACLDEIIRQGNYKDGVKHFRKDVNVENLSRKDIQDIEPSTSIETNINLTEEISIEKAREDLKKLEDERTRYRIKNKTKIDPYADLNEVMESEELKEGVARSTPQKKISHYEGEKKF